MPQIGYQDQCATGLQVSLTHSLIHSLTHSPTHPLTHSLTHYSFTHCFHPWRKYLDRIDYNALWRGPGSMPWTCWHPFRGWKPYSNLLYLGLAWHSIFARSSCGLWQFIHSLVIEPYFECKCTVVVNCAFRDPGNWQFWDMLHVGKRCGKLCLDHQDDVVYKSHLWMKFVSMLEALFFLCWKHCLLDYLHNHQVCHRYWIHHGHG